MFAISALLGVAALTLFVFQVMIVVSDRKSSAQSGEAWNEARDGTVETFESVGNIVAASFSVAGNIAGIITIIILSILIGLLLLTAIGVGVANFGGEVAQALDSTFSEVWPEFYETIVLGLLDPLRALYNAIIPFTNSINGSWRILRLESLDLALECDEADWGQVAISIRNSIVNLIASVVSWVLSFGGVDFDLYTPIRDLQEAIDAASPVLTCWCDALSVVRSLVDMLTSPNLASSLDRILNVPIALAIDLIHSTFGILVHFAEEITTTGSFVSALEDFYWDPMRAPTLDRTLHTLGQMVARNFDWLDDVVVVLVRLFYTMPAEDVPRILGIFGNYVQSLVLDVNIIITSWGTAPFRRIALLGTRYSTLWNISRTSALRTEDQLTEAFAVAHNGSVLIETFFDKIAAAMTDNFNASHSINETELVLEFTGCMAHESADLISDAIEALARAWVALWHERLVDGTYGSYMSNTSIVLAQRAANSTERFMACAAGLATILDDELGQFINETGHVLKAVVDPLFELQKEWDGRAGLLNSTEYRAIVDNVFFEADAWAIAAGDFWRQFSFVANETVQNTNCRSRDVHLEQFPATATASNGTEPGDWETFYPFLVDPFCCLGSMIETGTRLIFGLFEGVVRSIVAFATSATLADGFVEAFGTGGPLDVQREFLPMLDFFTRDIFRFSCIKVGVVRAVADVYFSGFDHACDASATPSWTIFEYIVDLFTGILRVPIKFFLGGAGVMMQWLVVHVDGGTCDATCWCKTTAPLGRIQVLYEETMGPVFDWIAEFLEVIACTFSLTDLATFADSMRATIGTGSPAGSGSHISRGDLFCVLVAWAEDVWDLFVCWSKGTDGDGFFGCIADAAWAAIEQLIDELGVCFTAWWNELESTIGCLSRTVATKCDGETKAGCILRLPTYIFEALLEGICQPFSRSGIQSQCTLASKRVSVFLPDFDTRLPPTESFTQTQHACQQFVMHSPEWYECSRNASANYTETATASRHHTRSTTFTTEVVTKTALDFETEVATWGYPPWVRTHTRIAQTNTAATIVITAVHAAAEGPPTFASPDGGRILKRVESTSSTSDSDFESPIAIAIAEANQRCSESVTFATNFAAARDRNEESGTIGVDQRFINHILIEAGLAQANASHVRCVASAVVAKMIDLGVGFVSDNETLVDPLTFYDPFTFLVFLYDVYGGAAMAFGYEMETASRGIDSRTLVLEDFYLYLRSKYGGIEDSTALYAIYVERILRGARDIAAGSQGSSWLGHLIETLGQWFGGEHAIFKRASSVSAADYYDDAPLHPAGWNSPKWLEFAERYGKRFRDGLHAFNEGAGWSPHGLGLEFYGSAKSKVVARYDWNQQGRIPEEEPKPRGTNKERSVWANLAMQAEDPRYFWESEEDVAARRIWAVSTRDAMFPSLTYLAQEDDHDDLPDLIPNDVLCPPGVGGESITCGGRKCWSASGTGIGTCVTRADPLFGSPVCGCEFDKLSGACCTDVGCSDVANAAACASPNVFAPSSNCSSSVCSDVRGACCAANSTCAVTAGHAECVGTFLTGSGCGACADNDLTVGACCENSTCSMTDEVVCNAASGIWHVGQNCSSNDLSSECGHCTAPACKQCELLFETLNDVIDLWIINLEGFKDNVSRGACCFGESSSNRSCALVQRSECNDLADSKWFWGEQCTFCDGSLAFSFANRPTRRVAQLNIGELEDLMLRALELVVNTGLRALEWLNTNVPIVAWLIPDSIEGATFDAHAFVESVVSFFFSNDPDDPGSLRFWIEFLFVCDPFNDPRSDRGRQGLGLIEGLGWSTIIFTLLYATIFRWWGFLGSLLASTVLVFAWLGLALVIAYFYSPACLAPAYVGFGIRAPVRFVEWRRGHPARKGFPAPPIPEFIGTPAIGPAPAIGVKTGGFKARLTSLRSRIAGLTKRIWRTAQSIFIFSLTMPLLPVELANDIMDLLGLLDIQCLPFCDVACPRENGKWPCEWMTDEDRAAKIKCIDAPDCCAVAECPESRVFPECASDPYNFDGGTREFAYWARVLAPKWNCFFLHSDFFLFAWIRQVPGVAEKLDFPGEECDAPDFDDARWRYCGTSNVLLLSPWFILLLLFYIFFAAILILAWVIFKAGAKLARRITSFWAAASRSAVLVNAETSTETAEGKLARGGPPRGKGSVLGHARSRASIKKD